MTPTPFELWLYRGLIAALLAIVWYYFRRDTSGIRKDIREVVDELKALTNVLTRHDEKIEALDKRMDRIDERLNEHHNDIREIRREHAKCQNFDPRP